MRAVGPTSERPKSDHRLANRGDFVVSLAVVDNNDVCSLSGGGYGRSPDQSLTRIHSHPHRIHASKPVGFSSPRSFSPAKETGQISHEHAGEFRETPPSRPRSCGDSCRRRYVVGNDPCSWQRRDHSRRHSVWTFEPDTVIKFDQGATHSQPVAPSKQSGQRRHRSCSRPQQMTRWVKT